MSNVNKGIKIFAWITGGLILILACLFIPVMKSYLYDPVITEQTVCYVYPKWNDVQLDSALHSVIPDENSIPRVKRLLSFYKFDSNVRVGAYRLHAGMTARQMALKLSRGSQSPIRVTFNNVRTLEQLAERVSGQLFFSKEELLALLYNDSVCADLGFTKATLPALFLPDTYEFYWTVTLESFLQKMKREYRIYWEGKREQQAKRWGLTPVEVATLASIVEEETNKRDEMGKVAGLYMNRLRKGMPLQADPTVKFAHGDFSLKRILNVHLTIESPYNTYRVTGLPPGPIRIPSKQAINAVLTHTPNGYFYMCAKEDFSGYHNFAVTLAEHQRNAIRYQQALNRLGIR